MTHSSLSMAPLCVLLLIMAAFLSTAVCKKSIRPNQCAASTIRCGTCGKNINVTIIARNWYTSARFEQRVTIVNQPKRPLLYFLQKAADQNGAFNFSASYHGNLGFMVNTINGMTANVPNKTYWNIKSVTNGNSSLRCGVSTYVPNNSEVFLFNFTTWG